MFEKYSNSFLRDFKFDYILNKFEKKTFHNYSEGEFIYRKNEPIINVYFILSGEIKLIKTEEDNDFRFTLRSLTGGDIIGIDDALMGMQYTNSSYVSKNSNVLAVRREDFMRITNKNDEFNFWILKYLSSRDIDMMLE
ncbi:MAG: Crp/Fnr family transcriptional regulator [Ignavibacteria bacterium]|nr:Crp/Fnr family transcriptional regulator [Ignavibacteria bacterium]